MSDIDFNQCCNVRFCFRLEHNATEIFAKLQQAYEGNIYRQLKAFSEGRESIDTSHSGRPVTARTEKNVAGIWDLVLSDYQNDRRKVLSLNHTTIH